MNKHLLLGLSLAILSSLTAFSQIDESEPNNAFGFGNSLPENTIVSGQVCMWDDPDYFQVILPEDGLLRIHTSIAGEGTNPNSPLVLGLKNEEGATWGVFTPVKGENGSFATDVNDFCCLLKDTFYVYIESGYFFPYCYTYTLSWELLPASFENDLEPNSNYTDALPMLYDTPTEGHLSFIRHPQFSGQDSEDYYRLIAPVNGTLRLFIESEAQSTGSGTFTVYIHDKHQVAWYNQTTNPGAFLYPNSDTLIWESDWSQLYHFLNRLPGQ